MTLMTSPTERDDELPSDEFAADAAPLEEVPSAARRSDPGAEGSRSNATLGQLIGRIDDLERLLHKVRGVSARAFYTTVTALVALAVGAFSYVGGQFGVVHDRIDSLSVEVRATNARVDAVLVELRESEARQIQRVDELARELRAEIRAEVRASEERQNSRIDELARELRAAMDVLADIQARLVRLETIAGLSPLPVAPPSSAPTAD